MKYLYTMLIVLHVCLTLWLGLIVVATPDCPLDPNQHDTGEIIQ